MNHLGPRGPYPEPRPFVRCERDLALTPAPAYTKAMQCTRPHAHEGPHYYDPPKGKR
jgi:hypothetical protein